MADEKQTAKKQTAGNANQQGIQVIAQYIKDFSFENPHAPESLISGWPQPETNVNISLRPQKIKDDTYECAVHFHIEAKKQGEDKTCFIIDLSYGALAVLKNIPEENHQPVVMVEIPKLIFPFAREIVADATAKGGFPPLYMAPINFESLYVNEMKRLQAEKDQATATN